MTARDQRPPDKSCPACGKGVPAFNDHCYACGFDYPGPEATEDVDQAPTELVVVYNYPGRTQADAATVFAQHAQEMASLGYLPVAQSWAEGRPGVGRVLAIGVFAQSLRPNGYLTVTYHRVSADGSPRDRPDDPIDQIRRLGQLRDEGLINDDEYQVKKAELLGRL